MSEELEEFMKIKYAHNMEVAFHNMVEFSRHLEEEKKIGNVVVGGLDFAQDLLTKGAIEFDTYGKLVYLINNPEAGYEIDIDE